MAKVYADFEYSNAVLLNSSGNSFYIRNELRGTGEDWFYWMFAVEGEPGEECFFDMGCERRIGYWGPAISFDKENWHWLGASSVVGTSDGYHARAFRYRFPEGVKRVYFCHDLHYPVERFARFAREIKLCRRVLCTTEKGRECPYYVCGSVNETIFLLSRHHACESSGTYVLEGALSYLAKHLTNRFSIVTVPFVDYDGVVDGDQGKARMPHDHYIDYTAGIYSTVRAVKQLAKQHKAILMIDFHSPWQCGGAHDKAVLCCQPCINVREEALRSFGRLFEEAALAEPGAFCYHTADDLYPGQGWVSPEPFVPEQTTGFFNQISPGIKAVMLLETSYFGTKENIASIDGYLALGRALGKAIEGFLTQN
ncbi:MAG TPA: hypothetical protein PLT66_04150 [Bacillota bacterium]|nr:hypothetical protein [Bacillota bacterium]